jgi:hypothetical protein
MTTAQDIINQGLLRLGVLQIGTVADARQSLDGLQVLVSMLDGLTPEGVALDPNIPLQPQYEKAVVDMFAVEVSPNYGIQPPPYLMKRAENGFRVMQAAYVFAPPADFDPALRNLPSQRLLGQRGVPFSVASLTPDSSPQVTGFVLLDVNTQQTTKTDANCRASSTITLYPYTDTAMDEWEFIRPVVAPSSGSFTVTHQVNMVSDRIFRYVIVI